MRVVNPKVWTQCVNTVEQHVRVVKTECKLRSTLGWRGKKYRRLSTPGLTWQMTLLLLFVTINFI